MLQGELTRFTLGHCIYSRGRLLLYVNLKRAHISPCNKMQDEGWHNVCQL
jgi:hypothetical protein